MGSGVKSDASPALSEMMQMKINNLSIRRDPMQLRKLLLPRTLSVTCLLSGCSLFSGEEDVVKIHYRWLRTSLLVYGLEHLRRQRYW